MIFSSAQLLRGRTDVPPIAREFGQSAGRVLRRLAGDDRRTGDVLDEPVDITRSVAGQVIEVAAGIGQHHRHQRHGDPDYHESATAVYERPDSSSSFPPRPITHRKPADVPPSRPQVR
jgi:hypothetical protein